MFDFVKKAKAKTKAIAAGVAAGAGTVLLPVEQAVADVATMQASAEGELTILKSAAEAMGLSVLGLIAISVGVALIIGYLLMGKRR